MKHPADNCYYVDSDPGFEYLEGNRDPQERMDHIKQIANAMRRHEHIPIIMVARFQGHLYVVDGQHRYEAAKMLWENEEEYNLYVEEYNSINPFLEAIKFNTTKLDWKISTYLRGYAINKYPNYQEFLDWISEKDWNRKTTTPYSVGLALLGVSNLKKLKEGVFQLGIPFNFAEQMYDKIKDYPIFSVVVTNKASAKAFYRIFSKDIYSIANLVNNYDSSSTPPNSEKIIDWEEYFNKFL